MKLPPTGARSLDLDLRFLGTPVVLQYDAVCATCGEKVVRGSKALASPSTGSIAHTACGERLGAAS